MNLNVKFITLAIINCDNLADTRDVMRKLTNSDEEFYSKLYWHFRALKTN